MPFGIWLAVILCDCVSRNMAEYKQGRSVRFYNCSMYVYSAKWFTYFLKSHSPPCLSCLFLECYTDIFFPIFLDCALEKPFEISWGCKVVKWSKRSHLSVIMWCWPQDWQCRGRSNKGSACHRFFLTYIVNVLFTVFLLCLLNVLLYN